MRLWPFSPPKTHLAPGDLCRIRNHPDVMPFYRGAYATVVSALVYRRQRKKPLGPWAHEISCRRGASTSLRMYISPEYLVKIDPPGREKGSWDECPFNPHERAEPIPLARRRAPLRGRPFIDPSRFPPAASQ